MNARPSLDMSWRTQLDGGAAADAPIMRMMLRLILAVCVGAGLATTPSLTTRVHAAPQTPQPFPRPGGAPARPAAPAPVPPAPATTTVAQPAPSPNEPTAETLGIPVYPTAQFLASYDAGRGQRYYIFGVTASFATVVGYYQSVLDERGDEVYRDPATHMFMGGPLGRYRDETMAFPPSVTVKDWTSGGSPGYPNLEPGADPARFPTTIQIVPAPPGAAR